MKKLTFIGAFVLLLSTHNLTAQASCGNIITPENIYAHDSPIIRTPITDCDNPFEVTIDPPSPYTLFINSQIVTNGASLTIPGGETSDIRFEGRPHQSVVGLELYRREGSDYRFVSLEPSMITMADYEVALPSYFVTASSQQLYSEILAVWGSGDNGLSRYFRDPDTEESIVDPETGAFVSDRFYNFIDEVQRVYTPLLPTIGVGTYIAVFRESTLILSYDIEQPRSFLEVIKNHFIPTAYAQCAHCIPEYIYTVTFTIVAEEELQGASSVLFLPGIMGSHLYETGNFCEEDGEVQLWFSANTCKQLRLKTRFDGVSVNEIYTKATTSAVIDEMVHFNLYKSFLNDLSNWESDGIIGDYRVVPYDWRLRIDDILKTKITSDGHVVYDPTINYKESYLYQMLAELATTSSSAVTIVVHSNGGLIAKAFLDYLEKENDVLLERVKNLILIGTPQNGTPEAVVGILHGSALGGGWISSGAVTRTLLQTGPFGHHLLPNESYFDRTLEPIISFEPGPLTDSFIDRYGEEITSREELHTFLVDSKLGKPDMDDLKTPSVLDPFLLSYANTAHVIQQAWQAPHTLSVHQVVGTGLQTPVTLRYFTDHKCTKRNPLKLFQCAERIPVLSYEVVTDRAGDGTVVDWSANVYSGGIGVQYLDLQSYNKQPFTVSRVHRDILEVPEVRAFISDIILGQANTYTFLSDTAPSSVDEETYIAHVHSPLDLVALHRDGEVISSSTPDYEGIAYRRFGEVQQITVPEGEYQNITFVLYGYEEGSFTFRLEKRQGVDTLDRVQFSAIPTSTSTVVEINPALNLQQSTMLLDYDGDSEPEVRISYNNETITFEDLNEAESPVVSSVKKRSGTFVQTVPVGKVAGVSVSTNKEIEYLKELYRLLSELYQLLVILETVAKK